MCIERGWWILLQNLGVHILDSSAFSLSPTIFPVTVSNEFDAILAQFQELTWQYSMSTPVKHDTLSDNYHWFTSTLSYTTFVIRVTRQPELRLSTCLNLVSYNFHQVSGIHHLHLVPKKLLVTGGDPVGKTVHWTMLYSRQIPNSSSSKFLNFSSGLLWECEY